MTHLQVLSEKAIPGASINEIKSVLVSALATNGRMAEALDVYDEIKQVNANLEPKATISLIVRFYVIIVNFYSFSSCII